MTKLGISAAGAYLPLYRIDRKTVAQALRFSGLGKGPSNHRSTATWDEDPITMAVEAARALGSEESPDSLVFASTSAPFLERSHAALVGEALALSEKCRTRDVAGSRRCAVSALLDALLGSHPTIIAAAEQRPAKAGNPAHFNWGDGGAAIEVKSDGPITLLGHASHSHDFLDVYRSQEHPDAYVAEERFARDAAISEIIVPTISRAMEAAGVDSNNITHVALHEPLPRSWKAIAKVTGITAPNHCETVTAAAGDLGAAHPLFGLGIALDEASPGDKILLAGFGSGCEVLILDVTAKVESASSVNEALNKGKLLNDYVRFLHMTQALELDWGVRAEFEQKAQATVLARYGRDMIGFIGGRDSKGIVQFPKSSIPVNPELSKPEILEDVRLADVGAKVISITADRLNFTPDPPFDFGLVQFDNGARVLMEMVDRPDKGFAVGDPVRMCLRIKSHNKKLGSRTYFWKAAPAERPQLETE